jgi:threonine/homoserine/homoserine lactone efflux protein
MTIEALALFSGAFLLLAVSPGAGLAMILSRALGAGMASGFAVTTGLILGDFVFLGVAMVGLSAVASTMGPLFQVLKYAGAVYLIWLGVVALRAAAAPIPVTAAAAASSRWRDVGMGLFVTLGNPKPILFYGALVPTLLDVSAIGARDFMTLGAVVTAISYAVYGAYMLMIERARRLLLSARAVRTINIATGGMFVGSGLLVATR